MPATSPEAKARQSQHREARRREKLAADPAYRAAYNAKREARRKARLKSDPAYREKRRAIEHRREERRTGISREMRDTAPFVGCDGEGARRGTRDNYVLFRMGDRELHANGKRLTTPDLLSFILDHPNPRDVLVAFAFEYDISNILRDVKSTRDPDNPDRPSRLERILSIDVATMAGSANPYSGAFGWTWLSFDGLPDIGVSYIPRNYLKVCFVEKFTVPDKDGGTRILRRARPGSVRTIYDTFGFFQSSFLKALEQWKIGVEYHAGIAAMKDARGTFVGVTQEVRDYCAIECRLLGELMTAFRKMCLAADIRPRTWNGAGKLASALLAKNHAMTAKELAALVPAGLLKMAHEGYYGGRFEVTRIGRLPAVTEHDINSAYTAAMLDLPCLACGKWRKVSGERLALAIEADKHAIFIAPCSFTHPDDQFLCGLPFRSRKGGLLWPRHGNGVYWSPEIHSAVMLGARVHIGQGWLYEKKCKCRPYDWAEALYDYRLSIGKGVRGQPIKLGLASLYGKKAQRIGQPRYANPIDAGLITAFTRAKLNDAIRRAGPRRVVMIATDGIYTTGGPIKFLKRDIGEKLGQWEIKTYPSLFIVRPGLYWPPAGTGKGADKAKPKTRGLSPKFFEPRVAAFESAWTDYMKDHGKLLGATPAPKIGVTVDTFIGLRLAYRMAKPGAACQWERKTIDCTFDWTDKRRHAIPSPDRNSLILEPRPGHPFDVSTTYDPAKASPVMSKFAEDRMLWEAMPDYVDLSPPFK